MRQVCVSREKIRALPCSYPTSGGPLVQALPDLDEIRRRIPRAHEEGVLILVACARHQSNRLDIQMPVFGGARIIVQRMADLQGFLSFT